ERRVRIASTCSQAGIWARSGTVTGPPAGLGTCSGREGERRGGESPPRRVGRLRRLNSRGVFRHELSRLAPYRTEPPRHALGDGPGSADKLSGGRPGELSRAGGTTGKRRSRRRALPRESGPRSLGTGLADGSKATGNRNRLRRAGRREARRGPSRKTGIERGVHRASRSCDCPQTKASRLHQWTGT